MTRRYVHFLGAACLLLACFIAWPSEKPAPNEPSSPETSRQTENKRTSPNRSQSAPSKIKPFFDSPQLILTANSSDLKSSTLQDQLIALESLFALPPSARRDDGIAYVLKHLAKLDPEIAKQQWLTWEHALTEPWLKAAADISLALAKDDPFAPSDFISQHLPRTAQLATWEPIIRKMDYQAASKVLATFPRSKRVFNLTKSLSTEWMKSDPKACAAWLDSLIPTFTEEQRKILADAYGAFSTSPKRNFDHFSNRLEAYHAAQNPLTKEYLAGLVLKANGITKEQKAAFMEELAETLPDYYAKKTAPPNTRGSEYYNTPVKFASTLKPADFQQLTKHDQSTLVDRLIHASPEKASKFLVRIDEPRRLYYSLIKWHQGAPDDAVAFAKTLPATKDYQRSILNFAHGTAHSAQKESTLALVKLLKNPKDQQKIRAKLAEKLKAADE